MDITNKAQALEFIAAWGGKVRGGILKETIRGLTMCEGISRSGGHQIAAAGYKEAIAVLKANQQEI